MHPSFRYKVERKSVKYARLRITPQMEVRLTVPLYMPEEEVKRFLIERQIWIEKTLATVTARRKQAAEILAVSAEEVLYLGEGIAPPVALNDTEALTNWYKQQAKRVFANRIAELSRKHQLPFQKLFVRDTRTKWGSCSSLKNIGLNWRLIKAPLWVLDYVILHELAHTIHMNHSQTYWNLVAKICPDYENAVTWLKNYGNALM